jgi:effector-binding domain-containing protein
MRVLIALAALLLAAPLAAQQAPAPASPPAAATPPTVPEIARPIRSIGRSTGDREVEEVELRAIPVAISPVRGRVEQVADIVRAGLGELRAAMAAGGLSPAGPAMTVYSEIGDVEFAAELMIPIAAAPARLPQGVRVGRSPDGRAVRIVHPGAHDELNETYEQLSTVIEDRDIAVRDMVIERYLNDPADTAPQDLRTEIYVLME